MSATTDEWDALTPELLRGRRSAKWTLDHPEALGAWVAEMDLGTAPAVVAALAASAEQFEFGYLPEARQKEMSEATAALYRERYGWDISPADVSPVADVIKALELAILEFSAPGAPVIVPTPAYMPFLFVPPMLEREVITVPMLQDERGAYTLDLAGIEAAFEAGGDLLILANPGNPIGKVYSRDELLALADTVARHEGRVFSDEIHAPLALFGHRHVPFASVSPVAADLAITATSASKAWNLPGLKCAQIILSSDRDRARWESIGMMASHGASTPGVIMNSAAYIDGLPWLEEVIAYVEANDALLRSRLAEMLPAARVTPLEGTYLTWIDLRAYPVAEDLGEYLLREAKVKINSGSAFGEAGVGYIRLNIATSPAILTEVIDRIAQAMLRDPAPGTAAESLEAPATEALAAG